jgi:hypothetical protein
MISTNRKPDSLKKTFKNHPAQTPKYIWFLTQRGATLAKKLILSTFSAKYFHPFSLTGPVLLKNIPLD